MFGHDYFYYGLTRKYVSYFGTMFNNIYIEKPAANNSLVQKIKVPISYAPKEKVLLRYTQDPELTAPAISLPRMSFEIINWSYDGSRRLPHLNQFVAKNDADPNKGKLIYTAAPYNITFNLNIFVKHNEDGMKIWEQINWFFSPDFTATLQLIPEMGISLDIPVLYTGNPVIEDKYEGGFRERQVLVQTHQFVMKGYYFGPTINKPLIKFSNMNFYMGLDATDAIGTIQVKPGLTANGEPTSNAAISLLPGEIMIDDDFGFITETSGIILTE